MTEDTSQPLLILASASPRRRELLEEAGYRFEVRAPAPEAESGPAVHEDPHALVVRLARQKAANVASRCDAADRGKLVVGCDTVAVCQGQILGKPADLADATAMLRLLSGRDHDVLSGLCVWPVDGPPPLVRLAQTRLRMDELTAVTLQEYLDSGAWRGKAGAFGYQDRLGWVHVVEGSETNVVGLPMELLAEMIAELTG
jgi:septum formation protein